MALRRAALPRRLLQLLQNTGCHAKSFGDTFDPGDAMEGAIITEELATEQEAQRRAKAREKRKGV